MEFTVRRISDGKQFLMSVMNGRKIARDQIENVCFDVRLIAKGVLSYEPEVRSGWKFEARINI